MRTSEEGAYLLRRIRANCHDDGGCLVWEGHVNTGTTPIINVNGIPTTVRRLVFELTKGGVKPGHEVVCTCETLLCCEADHLEQITVAERRRRLAIKHNGKQPARLVNLMRERHGKLDMEKARAIRASDEQAKVLAERYGVSSTLIGYVRRGISWAEPSPFAGLLGR